MEEKEGKELIEIGRSVLFKKVLEKKNCVKAVVLDTKVGEFRKGEVTSPVMEGFPVIINNIPVTGNILKTNLIGSVLLLEDSQAVYLISNIDIDQ